MSLFLEFRRWGHVAWNRWPQTFREMERVLLLSFIVSFLLYNKPHHAILVYIHSDHGGRVACAGFIQCIQSGWRRAKDYYRGEWHGLCMTIDF